MTLPPYRTILSLTTKKDILALPGFEGLNSYTLKELKEFVRKRMKEYTTNTRGFTVGDYMAIYENNPEPYKPARLKSTEVLEDLKVEIDEIAKRAKNAQDTLKTLKNKDVKVAKDEDEDKPKPKIRVKESKDKPKPKTIVKEAKDDLKEVEAIKTIELRERFKTIAKEQPTKKSKAKEEAEEDREAKKSKAKEEAEEAEEDREAKALRREQERLRRRQEVIDRIAKKEVEAIRRGEITDIKDVKTDEGYKAFLQKNKEQQEAERDRKREEEIAKWKEEMQRRQFLDDWSDDY